MMLSVLFTDSVNWLCSGFINEDRLRDLLITMGDRFTDEEVGTVFSHIPNSIGRNNSIGWKTTKI